MEWNIVLAVIFGAVTVIGGVETSYLVWNYSICLVVDYSKKASKIYRVDRTEKN